MHPDARPRQTSRRKKPNRTVIFVSIAYLAMLEVYYVFLVGQRSSPLDEILMLVGLPFALIALATTRNFWPAAGMFGGYAAITLLGNVFYRYSGVSQPAGAFLDLALDLKCFLLVAAFYQLFRMSDRPVRAMEIICGLIIALALANSIIAIYDIFSNGVGFMGMPLERRGSFFQPQGFQSFKVRSAGLTMMASAFSFYFGWRYRSWAMFVCAIGLGLMVIAHQSAKELFAFMLALAFMAPGRKIQGLRPIVVALSGVVLGAILFLTPLGTIITGRVEQFTGDAGADKARTLLLTRGLQIAQDHFPLGTGAGTYASGPSYQMGYSEVYYKYGLDKVWGSSPEKPDFIQDAFWAKSLGESGLIGTLFYVAFIILLYGAAFKLNSRRADGIAIPACAVVILAIVTSTGSSPFTDDFIGVLLAFYAGFSVCMLQREVQQERRLRAKGARKPQTLPAEALAPFQQGPNREGFGGA